MIYYLGLGSNIGDSISLLKLAVDRLKEMGEVKKKSSIYKTEPFGNIKQEDFFNAVIEFEFNDVPAVLLQKIKALEIEIGRKETYKWGPREIDIDIIDSAGPVIKESELYIPHHEMEKRNFVLIPLGEINPDYKNREGKSISELTLKVRNIGKIERLNKVW